MFRTRGTGCILSTISMTIIKIIIVSIFKLLLLKCLDVNGDNSSILKCDKREITGFLFSTDVDLALFIHDWNILYSDRMN